MPIMNTEYFDGLYSNITLTLKHKFCIFDNVKNISFYKKIVIIYEKRQRNNIFDLTKNANFL